MQQYILAALDHIEHINYNGASRSVEPKDMTGAGYDEVVYVNISPN